MMMDDMLVIKLGGSVVTTPEAPFAVNLAAIRQIVSLLVKAGRPLCVVHGLGSTGRVVLPLYEDNRIAPERSVVANHVQNEFRKLHQQIALEFERLGLRPRSFDPEALFIPEAGEVHHAFLDPVVAAIRRGETPILYGGTLRDVHRAFSILSSDQILEVAAGLFSARSPALWICDTDGVLSGDRRTIARITPQTLPDVWRPDMSADPSGAMENKLRVAIRMAQAGISSALFGLGSLQAVLNSHATSSGPVASEAWTIVSSTDWSRHK